MRTPFLTVVFLCFVTTLRGQIDGFASPASSALGLSGAGDTTVWSIYTNPSGFTTPTRPVAGMGYHNAFGLKDLSTRAAFVYLPTALITTSVGYVSFGNRLYSLQRFSAGFAREISPRLHLGTRFVYLMQQLNGQARDGAVLVDAGMRYSPARGWTIGLMALNAAQAKVGRPETEQSVPSSLSVSVAYRVSSTINTIADIIHRSDSSLEHYGFQLEARVHSWVVLRGAISGRPVRLAIGTSLQWSHLSFDIAVNHHDPLGFSSSAGIYYTFPVKNK